MDDKCRPFPGGAVDTDRTPVLFDDAVTDRKPKTCAVFLGRVKGVEDFFTVRFGYTRAGVRKTDGDEVVTRREQGGDRQGSAFGHRFSGVQDDVDEDLLDLIGVRLDLRDRGIKIFLDPYTPE